MYKFSLRRKGKIILDVGSILLGFLVAHLLKYDLTWSDELQKDHHGVYIMFFLLVYLLLNLQNKSWRYTSIVEISQIIFTNIMAGILMLGTFIQLGQSISVSMLVFTTLICTLFQLFNRYVLRVMRYVETMNKVKGDGELALVIGAGEAGESIAKESRKNPNFKYDILGFLDDNPKRHGVILHGYRVLGGRNNIPNILEKYRVKTVIIAIPSATGEVIKELRNYFVDTDIKIKVLPAMESLLDGRSTVNQLRDVKIEDLLGRKEVSINNENLDKLIEGKTVFVTGGAGSIGSELGRQIAKHNPKRLVAIDVNENDIYFLELELKRRYSNLNFVSEICNVRERDKVEWLFDKYRPELVFHAAAHKHVPLMEHNPEEAIKNNIMGTKNVADAAEKYESERFVLVSTDKAVNPTNIMGATKRACEIVIQEKAKNSKTKYMAVRFGNVLGSNGSVIPIFKKLIEEGKNLTLTHKDITRYFMTIPEAAQLVIEAGYLGRGGEVFILDMGEPIKIIDLAKNLIELADADVGIDIVGLRPGEKLYEELLYDVNAAIKTENRKIFISKLKEEAVDVENYLKVLKREVVDPDVDIIKGIMKEFVSTYAEPSHHFEEKKAPVREKLREAQVEEEIVAVKGKVALA
ncbi:UDP-4-dehydro-6-deoxy-2-acetamido-D-glucose 4-reductase [Propionigenium maris DSM 9537]|uniref:UDP-4-dehydro-6-deoxy-2-acetamido-D-glucose 4-reductase n=1 Tax=Propionigenium maris DSM 9537 TaxID=1123000 RepID=A0A9W6GM18_9FUSO|nr:nucleoside-diphosphate sugar epimerase/dehydratase [Propionigenium maris]GLI56908.1 UDP-4-dehydro-6-deoxy-2-acetamido-D-glucose 4-reductase [Propionigenium maris DSM 9537]